MRNLVRLFLGIAMLIIFTQPSWAEDKTCTTSGCTYQVPLDRTGFYIAVVTLPSGQPEGVWSLLMNPGRAQPYYGGAFFAGGTLKEHSQSGSWIGFSLAEGEPVTIKPTNYTNTQAPLQIRLDKGISDGGRALVQDWALRTPGQTFTTQALDPGFYVISVLSQPETLNNTFFGLDLGAPSIYGGVVGGWLDSQPGSMGYGAFYLASPQTMDFQLMFDGDYGTGGAGQPHLEIYYQKEDGTREVYWSAPQDSVGEVIEPTIPVVLPEPAVLPPDPGEAGKTTLEGIDSDKDGVRDDVQRYIALTYPNPEDKPFRAALREYSAFQRVFITEADDTWKTIANAENRAKQIDCVLYLHPEDGQAGLVNLRAEYLNTELRTRTYLTADGQLGGQPISLMPLEDLPQLCQKFTTRSSAMTRSSRQSASSCKKDTGTVINLSNGAMTDAESAQRELTMLRTHVESAKASSAISGEKLSYVATYNSTENWISSLLDSMLPKLAEESPNNTSKFWRWLGHTEQPPQTFIDVSLDIANNPAFVVPQDLQSHVGTYRTFIDEGRKVVALAHAEGNFYASQVYESLDETGQRARKDSFGVVSIAGGNCAMAVAGSAVAVAGGGCTDLQTDQVISAESTAGASVSISNSVVHILTGFVQDLLDHSFLSYLEGDISGPKIVNDVITAIPKLTPSPIVSQGVITVRLEWGTQPDVDLHIYEPSSSHVYFASRNGVSGYLDRDDTDGEGPEHYYAKCETLQPGLYKVAVNYFNGTGPETARINISAGGIIRSYTVPLASANSGVNQIPVAVVKVTQDEQSGEFKFDILSQKTSSVQGTTTSSTVQSTTTVGEFCASGSTNVNSMSQSCSNGNCSSSSLKITCNSENCQWCDANKCGKIRYNAVTHITGGSISCHNGQCNYNLRSGGGSSRGNFSCNGSTPTTSDNGTTPNNSENGTTPTTSDVTAETLLIAAQITDPQTSMGAVFTDNQKTETLAIFGQKDNEGRLTSVTEAMLVSQTDHSKWVKLTFGSDHLPNSLEFPDGTTAKFSNFTQASVDIVFFDASGKLIAGPVTQSVDAGKLQQLKGFAQGNGVRTGLRKDCIPKWLDTLIWLGFEGFAIAACATSVAAIPVTVGASISAAAWACGSAILNSVDRTTQTVNDGKSPVKVVNEVNSIAQTLISCATKQGAECLVGIGGFIYGASSEKLICEEPNTQENQQSGEDVKNFPPECPLSSITNVQVSPPAETWSSEGQTHKISFDYSISDDSVSELGDLEPSQIQVISSCSDNVIMSGQYSSPVAKESLVWDQKDGHQDITVSPYATFSAILITTLPDECPHYKCIPLK